MGAAKDATDKSHAHKKLLLLPLFLPNTIQVATLDLRNQLTSHIICPVKPSCNTPSSPLQTFL